jgi:cell division protein FtsB
LSPLVSGFTQAILWICRARSYALLRGLRDLIVQLDPSPLAGYSRAVLKVTTSAAPPIHITVGGKQLVTDADGTVAFSLDSVKVSPGNSLNVAAEGPKVSLNLISRASGEDRSVTSGLTGPSGLTSILYRFDGPAAYASRTAKVSITNGAAPVDATVNWTINSPKDAVANSGKFDVTAAEGGIFANPPATTPGSYQLDLTVTRGADALAGCAVTFEFQRNDQFDFQVNGELVNGEVDLLAPLTNGEAFQLAGAILSHPMIVGPNYISITRKPPFLERKPAKGSVVEREELIRLLLELAATKEGQPYEKLREVLARNGVPFPDAALAGIRTKFQEQEMKDPNAAANTRQAKAILEAVKSDFVGKINGWFDQTMTRVTSRYALYARVITVMAAFAVAFTVQVDSLQLLSRLSTDSAFRDSLVKEAEAQQKQIDSLAQTKTTSKTSKTGTDETTETAQGAAQADHSFDATIQAARKRRDEIQVDLDKLREPQLGVISNHFPNTWPYSFEEGKWNWFQEGQGFLGVLVTAMLLSLGAPFWYDALKDLLKLRPALAGKEEKERIDRQEDTPAPTKGASNA